MKSAPPMPRIDEKGEEMEPELDEDGDTVMESTADTDPKQQVIIDSGNPFHSYM